MKIPHQIRIKKNSKPYEVVWQDVVQGDPECLGLCDPNTRIITLKNGMGKDEILETFVHECLHLIELEYPKIKIAHSLIYKLEKPIVNLLKLNGWVIF